MNKKTFKKYSFFLFPVYLFVLIFVGFAMVTPVGKMMKIDFSGEKATFSNNAMQASAINDCKFENGLFVSTGNDPHVVFDCSKTDIKAFSATFDAPKTDSEIILYYDMGNGFSEGNTVLFSPGDTMSFDFAKDGEFIKTVRFDFEKQMKLEKVDFYENCDISYNKVPVETVYYYLVPLIAFILSVLIMLVEGKTKAGLRIYATVKNNLKPIGIFVCGILASAVSGAVATYFIYLVMHRYSIYLFFFVFAVFAVIFEILFFSKTAGKKTERLFLSVCLTIGFMMIIITPIGHASWDTGVHYRYVLQSSPVKSYYGGGDRKILINASQTYPSDTLAENHNRNALLNTYDEKIAGETQPDIRITHLFSGIAVRLAKYSGFSFAKAFMLGKVPILLIYAFVCYFAIKKLNSGKMLVSVIALIPTCLLLATNYSYDYWVIAFSLLGLAYFYTQAKEPLKPVSKRDTYIMYGALFLACIPKAIYLTLLIIPLFMPRKKLPNKLKYYLTCAVAFLLLFAIFFIKAKSSVAGGGDLRGGSDVNAALQLSGIIHNPIGYAKILSRFLARYVSIERMHNYIDSFAYLGDGKYFAVFLILMIILGLIDKNDGDKELSKWYYKSSAVIIFAVTIVMIATALYIDFTPVGSQTIIGCQYRYMVPLLFPVCYTLGSFKKNLTVSLTDTGYTVTNALVFAACSFAIFGDIYLTTLTKMV